MDGLLTATKYYQEKYKQGKEYEKWVKYMWPKVYGGKTLHFFQTKEGQLIGETLEKLEVKNDNLILKYKRVFIETAEKTNPENERYVSSGIYRKDNTKWYLVGDKRQWFIFTKRRLQEVDIENPSYLYRPLPKPKDTKLGFAIPVRKAKELCIEHKEFDKLF